MGRTNPATGKSPAKTKDAWLKEAIDHYKAAHYEEALFACEQAIALDPTFARAYHGKGLILTYLQKYTDALSSYEKARQLAPNKAKIYADLAELFMLLHDEEKARENYKQAFKLDESYKDAYFTAMKPLIDPLIERAAVALAHNNYIIARDSYRQASEINPDDSALAQTYLSIGQEHPTLFYTSEGNFYTSETALEELREEHPDIFRR